MIRTGKLLNNDFGQAVRLLISLQCLNSDWLFAAWSHKFRVNPDWLKDTTGKECF